MPVSVERADFPTRKRLTESVHVNQKRICKKLKKCCLIPNNAQQLEVVCVYQLDLCLCCKIHVIMNLMFMTSVLTCYT